MRIKIISSALAIAWAENNRFSTNEINKQVCTAHTKFSINYSDTRPPTTFFLLVAHKYIQTYCIFSTDGVRSRQIQLDRSLSRTGRWVTNFKLRVSVTTWIIILLYDWFSWVTPSCRKNKDVRIWHFRVGWKFPVIGFAFEPQALSNIRWPHQLWCDKTLQNKYDCIT